MLEYFPPHCEAMEAMTAKTTTVNETYLVQASRRSFSLVAARSAFKSAINCFNSLNSLFKSSINQISSPLKTRNHVSQYWKERKRRFTFVYSFVRWKIFRGS